MSSIRSINPATENVLAEFDEDTEEAVEVKLAAAQEARRQLTDAGVATRSGWLRAAADLLESEGDSVAALITAEMGKPIGQSEAEVTKSAHTMRFYAEQGPGFLTDRELQPPSMVNASAARTRFDPLGVVLAVMPWNYPIWQVVRFAAPALMAGNVGLLKHASNVPQLARYIGRMFARAGFPEGSFATLLVGSSRIDAIIRDRRVAAVTLTGSEEAGQAIGAAAGRSLKKAVLELGGSDPFIVMPSADLELAASTAVVARTSNNGQACINAKRFIVHSDVYDRFSRLFVNRMAALVVGDPADRHTDVGPLSTENGRRDLEALVEDARAQGATILTGGQRPEISSGWFYEPTVLSNLTRSMRMWSEEAFGPVAALYKTDSLDEALALANGSDFGLSSAFWSQDQEQIDRATQEIEAGAVFVNGMSASYPELPFGGIKKSGFGRELSAEGIREFCNIKTVWVA